jgi:hypothetical protein
MTTREHILILISLATDAQAFLIISKSDLHGKS